MSMQFRLQEAVPRQNQLHGAKPARIPPRFEFPAWLGADNTGSDQDPPTTDRHFADIFSSAEDTIISKDVDGRIQTWNSAAERVFGYSAAEVVGRSILLVIPSDLHQEEAAILQHIRSGQRIENYETRRLRRNGEEFTASVTISPIRDHRGRVTGASKIVRDITDSKQAEQARVRNEKLAATLQIASVIAHQINNPLESVVNLIYLAQRASKDEASLYLSLAQEELRRITHIAKHSMGVFHDPQGESNVNTYDLLKQAVSIYESRLLSLKIQVEQRISATRQVHVRRGELLQVICVVLANAIDAMPFGGRLVLGSRDLKLGSVEGVELVVHDTGMGIAKEHRKRLFEPFFTTKGRLGAGMGLWMAKQFVEKQNGQMSVESRTEPPNSGTSVTIFLPKAS